METNRLNAGTVVIDRHPSVPRRTSCGDFQTVQAYRVGRGGDHADPLAQRAIMGWKGDDGLHASSTSTELRPATRWVPPSNTQGFRAYSYTVDPAAVTATGRVGTLHPRPAPGGV